MSSLFDGLLGWLIGGGAVLVGLFATYFGVKRSGKVEAQQEAAEVKAKADADQAARAQAAIEGRIANEEAVRVTDDPGLRKRLREYARKG